MLICNKTKQAQTGFSLIEIMVAILILGTTFIGLIQAFPYALRIIKSAENKTKASYRGQEKIEEIYQLGYSGIGTGIIESRQAIGDGFERQTEAYFLDIDFATSTSDIGLKLITTTVYFTNAFSKNESSYPLSTIIADR